MTSFDIIALLAAGALIGIATTCVFWVLTYHDKTLVPRYQGELKDLPPWAQQEVTRYRALAERAHQEKKEAIAKSRKLRP